MPVENDEKKLSRIFVDLKVPREVKGEVMAASRKAKVKFETWALNVMIGASRTATEGEGFHLETKGGSLVIKGAGFEVPVSTDEASAREFVDFLNVAISLTNSARMAGNTA
jgi:hypothetical protein|tara:strand:- start:591 stop:923 length:333 start_codon:yes stop_codon:yes gene_type:complete